MLLGRRTERETLDRTVEAIRTGESRALVIRGDAGIGKMALLEYLRERTSGCRVARVAGIQPEMELAYAASYGRKLWMSSSHENAAYLPP